MTNQSLPPFSRGVPLTAMLLALLLMGGCGATVGASSAPEAPSRAANRLKDATSPYLLQHAHNPVDWYPWGPEAFERARKEGKPIFLSIGYSACHWCHVMERESFEDTGIAELLNRNFIAIKVDREERPDVDDLYITAVQLLTGGGGWPLSAFLTPEGKPFHGGTYLPRNDFAELLRKVQETWAAPERRKELEKQADKLAAAVAQVGVATPGTGALSTAVFRSATKSYLEEADAKEGGFGGAPKFPPSLRLGVLLEEYRKKPDAKLLETIRLTLDKMSRGGLYDQVGGGFHRYSVDAAWRVPHFEKMLYDNALLSWVYLRAYQETREPEYLRIAQETLEFTLRELRDPAGGFWSTLDADSRGPNGEREEGRFYLWTPDEVSAVLGAPDGALFCKIYDISARGNFEGRNIPNLLFRPVEGWAKDTKQAPEALRQKLDGMRAKLRAAREKRPRPALDDKVLANWNGLMLRSLALAHEVTGEARYRQAAEQTAAFLLDRMRTGDRLQHAYRGGKTQPQVFLEDYAYVVVGLTELGRVTGEERWRKEAISLGRTLLRDFWDAKAGVLYDTPHAHEALLLSRASRAEDNVTPSGQAMAALALVRLSRLTNETEFQETARKVLERQSVAMKRYPSAVAGLLLAAQAYFGTEEAAPVAAADPVSVELQNLSAPGTDGTREVDLRLRIGKGWHINGKDAGKEERVPTTVTVEAGPYQLAAADFPPLQSLKLGGNDTLSAYTDEVKIRLRLKPSPEKKGNELQVKVRYQPCNDRACLLPVSKTATLRIPQ